MGTLFIVATPIGNLEDITYRAVRILAEVDLILAEDTRRTRILLDHYSIENSMQSYHAFNERAIAESAVTRLDHSDLALVTDAGTPGISDPGRILIEAAAAAGHTVVPIPGPNAGVAAASASGLIDGPYVTMGFLARKGKERREQLDTLAATGYAFVLFESPRRVQATMVDLAERFPERQVVLFRELTKRFEERIAGQLSDVAQAVAAREIRGEIAIVVGAESTGVVTGDAVDAAIDDVAGMSINKSEQARLISEKTGLSRSDVYQRLLAREEIVSSPETPVSDDA